MRPGDWYKCKVCGSSRPYGGLRYEGMGVCAKCVCTLANAYSMQHGGRPTREFCTTEEWRAWEAANRSVPDRPDLRGAEWKNLRLQVVERDGLACHYCKEKVPPSRFTVDHIIPASRGGTNDLGNLVGCCKSCNSKKSKRDYQEFVAA